MGENFKFMNAGYPIHAPVEAALTLVAKHGIELDAIEKIYVGIPTTSMKVVDSRTMHNICLQDMLTAALVRGGLTLRGSPFPEVLDNPAFSRLRPRVSLHGDPDLDRDQPVGRGAIVAITMTSGAVHKMRVEHPKGHSLRGGATWPDLAAKWREGLPESTSTACSRWPSGWRTSRMSRSCSTCSVTSRFVAGGSINARLPDLRARRPARHADDEPAGEAQYAVGNTSLTELPAAIDRIHDDRSVRCVILTGNGPSFSAGGDIGVMKQQASPEVSQMEIRHFYRARNPARGALALFNLEVPVIAAINGNAIGAGLDLACMCDIRIASDKAKMAASFIKVGIIPGDGGAWLLPRVVGMSRAAELYLTGDTFDAQQALAWNLVSRVVPHDELLPVARELAGRITRHASHSSDLPSVCCAKRCARRSRPCWSCPPSIRRFATRRRTTPKRSTRSWRNARRSSVDGQRGGQGEVSAQVMTPSAFNAAISSAVWPSHWP